MKISPLCISLDKVVEPPESAACVWGARIFINNHPCPKDQEKSKAGPSQRPPPIHTLPSHLQNTQPLASPSYSSILGKTVCLHCPGVSRAFGEREASQPSDQTQRLVKRQKQLKVFMNNAAPPILPQSPPPSSQLSVVQAPDQCPTTLLCCSPKSEFHRKAKKKSSHN